MIMFTLDRFWKRILMIVALATVSVMIIGTFIFLYRPLKIPSVTTNYGKIIGHYRLSSKNNSYEAYEGIPYALPPTGERRFEPPQSIQPWTDELIADKFKEKCMGRRRIPSANGYLEGIEDCLYLNVYAPKNKSNKLLPVIFWIYGGAFQYGDLTGDEQFYLIDYSIIFVSFNYRHGSLGFLSTGDEVVPGNMGLKDQAMALRWVSENIKFFGGDPERVMLAGDSAGGASVHYHYLSPMTKGLFQSGISFSGTALNPWAQMKDSKLKAVWMGELMNCPINAMVELIKCLKTLPADKLVDAQANYMSTQLSEFAPFGPVVEKSSENIFIDRPPIEIIRSKDSYDAPWITGNVKDEGLFPIAEFITNKTVFEDLNKNWVDIAPLLLQYAYTIPKANKTVVAHRIREYYFKNETISQDNYEKLVHLVGDRLFVVDAEKAAREMALAHKSSVWFYHYTYRATDSFSDYMSGTKQNFGTCHDDDAQLILGNNDIDPKKSPEDFAMHQKLVEFLISVAREGKPNFGPVWHPVDAKNKFLLYLHMVGPEAVREEADDNFGQKHFWETISFDENIPSNFSL